MCVHIALIIVIGFHMNSSKDSRCVYTVQLQLCSFGRSNGWLNTHMNAIKIAHRIETDIEKEREMILQFRSLIGWHRRLHVNVCVTLATARLTD